MKYLINSLFFLLTILSVNTLLAADETSNSYQMGNLIGKVFIVVLIFLIVKKYIFKK